MLLLEVQHDDMFFFETLEGLLCTEDEYYIYKVFHAGVGEIALQVKWFKDQNMADLINVLATSFEWLR